MTNTNTPTVAEIREARAKITPPPWEPRIGSGNNVCTALCSEANESFDEFVCDVLPDYSLQAVTSRPDRWEANRDFIANTPRYVDFLLAEVERLEAENRRLCVASYRDIED